MARLTRHEILKEDRFMMLVDETRHFFANNRSEILRGLSAVGVVAALVAGYYYYSAKQEEHSKEELARALATYHATVGKTESSGSRAPVFFETPTQKYEQALSELQEVISPARLQGGRQDCHLLLGSLSPPSRQELGGRVSA